MSLHRFFAVGPLAPLGALPLHPDDVHHLRDVARLAPGEEIAVVADGVAYRVRLTGVEAAVEGEVLGPMPGVRVPPVTLVQALAKGDKVDTVVRQATEIGVSRVVVFAAERSVVRLEGAKAAARRERWQRIAVEAAKQSQRVDVPTVVGPVPFAGLTPLLSESVVLVCQEEDRQAPGIAGALSAAAPGPMRDVAVVVGPEGGLSAAEVTALETSGGVRVSLGDTVLRTETAGVVASALAIHARDGLGAGGSAGGAGAHRERVDTERGRVDSDRERAGTDTRVPPGGSVVGHG